MKRIFVTIFVYMYCVFIFWYGGADFLVRNILNAYFLLIATFVSGLVYTLPIWNEE